MISFRSSLAIVFIGGILGAGTRAADLSLSVRSSGLSAVSVQTGAMVSYEVIGELTDTANEGLALFGFDLVFSGGDLSAALPGTMDIDDHFVLPRGITNPGPPFAVCPPACGFGGTIIAGDLRQVGGGQNTILNFLANADFPIGEVMQLLGHTPIVLATGTLVAPDVPGDYVLSIPVDSVFANVIKQGETGVPFWATEAAGVGQVSNLTITAGGVEIVSWESLGFHGRDVNADVALEITASDLFSEPRNSGISKVVVTFDGAIDPGTAIPANVSLVGCDLGDSAVELGGIAMSVSTAAGDTQMIIEFSPKLPDLARYSISLSGLLSAGPVASQSPVGGDTDRILYAVLADVNNDRRVASNDLGGARSFVGLDPIDTAVVFQVRSDVNNDGRIASNDLGAIRFFIGGDARTIGCP